MKLIMLLESAKHDAALELISSLVKKSPWKNKVFLAGGAVRDKIIGKGIKDLDITVAAPNGGIDFATWLAKELKIFKAGTNPVVYPNFGTAKITLRNINYKGFDLSDIDVEMVMTRKEKYTNGSRKPEVDYGTPEQDVERRDLTINSLLQDLTTGEIKDLTGKGLSDIKNGIIRTPLNPDIIFKEDPLRMLRAIRFTVKYNWKLPFSMIKAIKSNANTLQTISSERIQDELNKILLSKNPSSGIKLLQTTGLSKYIMPELDYLIKLQQNQYHKWDAMKHTLEVLKKTPRKLITRLAGLFHDIGKVQTQQIIDNEIHFYQHEDIGAQIAKDILVRLKYPNDIINAVVIAIQNHMRTKSFGNNAELVSDKALRKLQNDLGSHLNSVLQVVHADNLSHSDTSSMPGQVPGIRKRLKHLNSKQDFSKIILPVNGDDLIKKFNLKSGPIIGKMLDAIKDAYLENPDLTKDQAFDIAKRIK